MTSSRCLAALLVFMLARVEDSQGVKVLLQTRADCVVWHARHKKGCHPACLDGAKKVKGWRGTPPVGLSPLVAEALVLRGGGSLGSSAVEGVLVPAETIQQALAKRSNMTSVPLRSREVANGEAAASRNSAHLASAEGKRDSSDGHIVSVASANKHSGIAKPDLSVADTYDPTSLQGRQSMAFAREQSSIADLASSLGGGLSSGNEVVGRIFAIHSFLSFLMFQMVFSRTALHPVQVKARRGRPRTRPIIFKDEKGKFIECLFVLKQILHREEHYTPSRLKHSMAGHRRAKRFKDKGCVSNS